MKINFGSNRVFCPSATTRGKDSTGLRLLHQHVRAMYLNWPPSRTVTREGEVATGFFVLNTYTWDGGIWAGQPPGQLLIRICSFLGRQLLLGGSEQKCDFFCLIVYTQTHIYVYVCVIWRSIINVRLILTIHKQLQLNTFTYATRPTNTSQASSVPCVDPRWRTLRHSSGTKGASAYHENGAMKDPFTFP